MDKGEKITPSEPPSSHPASYKPFVECLQVNPYTSEYTLCINDGFIFIMLIHNIILGDHNGLGVIFVLDPFLSDPTIYFALIRDRKDIHQ